MSAQFAMANPPTILDVLENALEELTERRIRTMTAQEIDDLAQAVNAFYDAWELPPTPDGDLRLYLGGWIAGNTAAPDARQHLLTGLLYCPSAVIHDPVAEWFDPGREQLRSPRPIRAADGVTELQGAEPQLLRGNGYYAFRDDPNRTRGHLEAVVPMLRDLGPLIRRQAVVPVPQWRLVRAQQDSILTAVRHDAQDEQLANLIQNEIDGPPPRMDNLRGMEVTPPGGTWPADRLRSVIQNPAYFLNKTAVIADATESRYVPPAATDAALWSHRVNKLGTELKRVDIDLQVISALSSADLPFLGGLDATTISDVHRNEDAFADWRAELRMVVRAIDSAPSEGRAFVDESRNVISDALLPRAREVEHAVSRSQRLKAAAADQSITLGFSAASAVGGAAVVGAPLAPAALAGMGMSAIGRAVYASVFGSKPAGTHAILATLIKKRS